MLRIFLLVSVSLQTIAGQTVTNTGWSAITFTNVFGLPLNNNNNQVPVDLNSNQYLYPYGVWANNTQSTDTCQATTSKPYMGYPFADNSAPPNIRFLYDSIGHLLGTQILIIQSNYQLNGKTGVAPTGAGKKYYNSITINSRSYYGITVFFNYPATQTYLPQYQATINVTQGENPCTSGRSANHLYDNGFGTGMWIQTTGANNNILNSSDPTTMTTDNLQQIPYNEYDIQSSGMWVQGNCINNQGTPYFYNANSVSPGSVAQQDWLPVVPLYSTGRLIGLMFLTQQPSLGQPNGHFVQMQPAQLQKEFGTQNLPTFFWNNPTSNYALTMSFNANPYDMSVVC